MPNRNKLSVIRFRLEEKIEELNLFEICIADFEFGKSSLAFPPKAQNHRNGRSPGLLNFVCLLSSKNTEPMARMTKSFVENPLSLQLRGQLRFLTEFPINPNSKYAVHGNQFRCKLKENPIKKELP